MLGEAEGQLNDRRGDLLKGPSRHGRGWDSGTATVKVKASANASPADGIREPDWEQRLSAGPASVRKWPAWRP